MNDQTFFLIIIVLILIYYLPGTNNINDKISTQSSQYQISQNQIPQYQIPQNQIPLNQIPQSQIPQSQIPQNQDLTSQTSKVDTQLILPYQSNQKNKTSSNDILQIENQSLNLINDYLNENECKEKFDTMGPNVNIGNNMDFKQIIYSNPSQLDKSLSKSMVPDFEPSYLNINPDLNSYGYATTNPEASEYYKARGFINPSDSAKFANSVSYMLAHPYQTKYCEKQN